MSGRFQIPAGTGAALCRALSRPTLTPSGAARFLAAIRPLLLCLAVLGLLLAPSARSAHGSIGPDRMIGMADHAPCCPGKSVDNCPKCALMASCAFHCIDDLAADFTFAVSFDLHAGAVPAQFTTDLAGIDHPPPLRPPRA